jgi:hypothetical protein
MNNQSLSSSPSNSPGINAIHIVDAPSVDTSPTFQINADRLLELFFENFWPALPIVLPYHHLQQRRVNETNGLEELLLVLKYIGAIYAPWAHSEHYLTAAIQALTSPLVAHTPFTVQALMLLGLAQYHSDMKQEGQQRHDLAVSIAIELRMNEKEFARAYGEANPVLEESWRRTYYMLYVTDQNLAIVSNSLLYTLANVTNYVDLPCDDEYYEAGHIPPVVSWQDYEDRELAEVEIVFSSIVYLYDMARIVANVMATLLETGNFSEALIDRFDTKLAIWTSLLPACKRDPLRKHGELDEVMFTAHMSAIITINTLHRPFSSLSLNQEELGTVAFLSPTPFVAPPKQGRCAHTARALRALEMQTKLLAIPCTIERHNVFTMCMSAQLATAQISACTNLLEDHALSIARDRVRLSIGFLNATGSYWTLGKLMAKEVRAIARTHLSNSQNTVAMESGPAGEVDFPRDGLIWPVDPSAQIDIYSGLMLPIDWDPTNFSYTSSTSSGLS